MHRQGNALKHSRLNSFFLTRKYSSAPGLDFYKLFPHTVPRGPPPAGQFDIDAKQLRQEYYQLQKHSHPDVSGNISSQVDSAILSNAYKTLLDPVERAAHVLRLNNIEPEAVASETNQELMLEVMEASEEIDMADTVDSVLELKSVNEAKITKALSELKASMNSGEFEKSLQALAEIRYFTRLRTAIERRLEELK